VLFACAPVALQESVSRRNIAEVNSANPPFSFQSWVFAKTPSVAGKVLADNSSCDSPSIGSVRRKSLGSQLTRE
jgi:hypothetical protein